MPPSPQYLYMCVSLGGGGGGGGAYLACQTSGSFYKYSAIILGDIDYPKYFK